MGKVFAPRVKQTTTLVGTTTAVPLNAVELGYVAWDAALNPFSDYADYMMMCDTTGEWECGVGQVTGANTFSRAFPYKNSAGTAGRLDFAAGTKSVILTPTSGFFKTGLGLEVTSKNGNSETNRACASGVATRLIYDHDSNAQYTETYNNPGFSFSGTGTVASSVDIGTGITTSGFCDLLIVGSCKFEEVAGGYRKLSITNGAGIDIESVTTMAVVGAPTYLNVVARLFNVSDGATFDLYATQDSGSSVNVLSAKMLITIL